MIIIIIYLIDCLGLLGNIIIENLHFLEFLINISIYVRRYRILRFGVNKD